MSEQVTPCLVRRVTATKRLISGQSFDRGSMSDREVKAYKQMFGVV